MSYENYLASPLWSILVETVHSGILYPHHRSYAESVVLRENPNITAIQLATLMGISIGEALVILHELRTQTEQSEPEQSTK